MKHGLKLKNDFYFDKQNKCPFAWKFNSFDLLYELAVKKHILIQR